MLTTRSRPPTRDEPVAGPREHASSFAAEALKLGGKSAEEVRRMGAVDSADDQVEALFAARYRTVNSPIHRAVWERQLPTAEFGFATVPVPPSEAARDFIERSLALIRHRRDEGTLLDESGKIRDRKITRLNSSH